jgi:hypothetical protein
MAEQDLGRETMDLATTREILWSHMQRLQGLNQYWVGVEVELAIDHLDHALEALRELAGC